MENTLPLIASLAAAGLLAGVLAGLFGIGGGVIIVPALFQVFVQLGYPADLAMHVAAGTSLAAILPTGFSSAYAHYHKGSVDPVLLRRVAPSTALGAIAGALLAPLFGGKALSLFFSVFIGLVAVQMMRGSKGFRIAGSVPADARRHVLGGSIGFVSSLLGIGGGTISVPTFAAAGYALSVAVGTGSALGIAIAAPGAVAMMISGWGVVGLPPFSVGFVNLLALAVIAPLSALLAPFGAKLSHTLPELWLKRSFAVLLSIVAVRMALKALM